MTYQDWINDNYPTPESAKLKCADATVQMCESFPELRRIRGHVFVGVQQRPHWWCETVNGEVVDPTAHQWANPPVLYEHLENDEEPHGKCMYCGDMLFRSSGDESFLCADCIRDGKASLVC